VAVLQVFALVGRGGLPQDLGDLGLDLVEGAVGLVGGVGGHLGAVQRDDPQADQACCRAQPQGGDQQLGQGSLVADAEPGDGHVVRRAVAGQHPEREVLLATPLDLPRRAHADRVGVQQHAKQRLGVVGGVAVPVGAVGTQERLQVELVDHVEDEPGQVALGQPVAQVGRQQERLVAAAAQEVVGHGLFYLLTAFTPNVLVLNSVLRKAPLLVGWLWLS
jgi:hypothetical protein